MISTPEQYDYTKELIAAFEEKINWLATNRQGEDPLVRKIEIDAYAAFIERLRCEVTEYEAAHQPDLAGAEQR